jgi:hypothetical protein
MKKIQRFPDGGADWPNRILIPFGSGMLLLFSKPLPAQSEL